MVTPSSPLSSFSLPLPFSLSFPSLPFLPCRSRPPLQLEGMGGLMLAQQVWAEPGRQTYLVHCSRKLAHFWLPSDEQGVNIIAILCDIQQTSISACTLLHLCLVVDASTKHGWLESTNSGSTWTTTAYGAKVTERNSTKHTCLAWTEQSCHQGYLPVSYPDTGKYIWQHHITSSNVGTQYKGKQLAQTHSISTCHSCEYRYFAPLPGGGISTMTSTPSPGHLFLVTSKSVVASLTQTQTLT